MSGNIKLLLNELIDGESNRMCYTSRYNSVPVIRRENVAEHSWKTSYIALNLYWFLYHSNSEEKINLGLLLSKALLHDVPEMLSSDIVATLKHYDENVNKEINRVSDEMLSQYQKDSCLDYEIYYDAIHSKEGKEGEIVAVSDLLCVFSYLLEEINFGNTKATKYIPLDRLLFSFQSLDSKLTIIGLKEIVKEIQNKIVALIKG